MEISVGSYSYYTTDRERCTGHSGCGTFRNPETKIHRKFVFEKVYRPIKIIHIIPLNTFSRKLLVHFEWKHFKLLLYKRYLGDVFLIIFVLLFLLNFKLPHLFLGRQYCGSGNTASLHSVRLKTLHTAQRLNSARLKTLHTAQRCYTRNRGRCLGFEVFRCVFGNIVI